MTLPNAVSVVVVVAGVLIGLLALGFSTATGGKRLRWFVLVAFSAALYALSNLVHDRGLDSGWVRMVGRMSMAAVHLHAVAWAMYSVSEQRRRPSWLEWVAIGIMLGLACLALVPGVLVTDQVTLRTVPWLGIEYLDHVPSSLGLLGYLVSIGTIVYVTVRFLHAWRQGVPGALPKFFGLVVLLMAATNDLLASEKVIDTPYLIEAAFLVVVVEVGFSLVAQFVGAARTNEAFAAELEVTVAHRTKQLVQVNEALIQSEKLAAVGRLAGGVAHEINNPAAVVAANVEYLQAHFATSDTLPEDGRDALRESSQALQRIGAIVRKLLDAGRVGGEQSHAEEFSILTMVQAAVTQARETVEMEVDVQVAEELTVVSARQSLEQAIVNLLVNAGQAIAGRPQGRVVVSARRSNNQIHLTVSDNGPGISPAAVPHVFEPFFTTRGPGRGTGLGLSVSLGLMRALGGNLRLAASTSAGTQMEIDLPLHLSPYDLAAQTLAQRP